MAVLMMIGIERTEAGRRRSFYTHLDMAGEEATLGILDEQVHDDLPSSCLGDIV